MAKKGIDTTFVHYGIRREDLSLMEALCTQYEIEFEWVKEHLLKAFHEKKIKNQEVDEKTLEKIIEKALNQIN